VIVRFLLDQKNGQMLLSHVQTLIGFGQVSLRKERGAVYRYSNNSFKGLAVVRNYYQVFPMKSKKALSFIKWNEVYTMVLAKDHLTPDGLDRIRLLAKEVNAIASATSTIGSANP
jgi:hypothetical protein